MVLTARDRAAVLEIVDARLEKVQVTREDFTELRLVVQELAQAQKRTEARMEELAVAQSRTELAVRELAQQVGRLSDAVGFGIEEIGREMLPPYLSRHFGIEVGHLAPLEQEKAEDGVEIDFYGVGKKDSMRVVVLGEAKSRIHENDVARFDAAVRRLDKAKGENLFRLVFGFRIDQKAAKTAKELGIELIAAWMTKQ